MVLAGLWAGVPYQGTTFLLALAFGTVALFIGTVGYALVSKRRGVLAFLALFPLAAIGQELFASLLFLAGIIGTPIALLLTLFRPRRRHWILTGQTALVAVTAICSIFLFGQLQTLGARHAAERGNRIVEAIGRYQRLEGKFPATLGDLVPRELESIPDTGMAGFPSFEYVGPVDGAAADEEHHLFAAYELRVNLYKLLNFDCLVYWPEGNYPDAMYGGGVQRIGEWAYVHE